MKIMWKSIDYKMFSGAVRRFFLWLFVEPHNRGNGEGRKANDADDRAGDDESRGEADLLGQESRTQQADGRWQQAETVIERHDAAQYRGVDAGLYHGGERGVEDAARNAFGGGENGEPDETRRGQHARQGE